MGSDRRLVALVFAVLAATARSQELPVPALPEGPFNNEYVIDVRLVDETRTLKGAAEVTWRNFSPMVVDELPFHLYPNAWANTRTQWVHDARAEQRILERGEAEGGYLAIDSIRVANGADLAAATAIDETLMRVRLPEPIQPGGEIALRIEFTTRLPRIVARMGYFGDHIDAMQWFPKVCAQRRDGTFADWPFREPSEFFANFGAYEVTIRTPPRFVVEATGTVKPGSAIEGADQNVATYVASAVHDFAWTADPNFTRRVARSSGGTEIVLLEQPFLADKTPLVLDVTRHALDLYGEWFMPYPYPRVVIDTLPMGGSGGMEYPMLFTISADAPEFLPWLRERSDEPAGVTVHEFGHQYWYGIVATNEVEEAWLDEGINTYVTSKVMESFFRAGAPAPSLPLTAALHVYAPLLDGGGPLALVAGYSDSPFFDADGRDGAVRHLFGFPLPELQLQGAFADPFYRRKSSYAPFANDAPLLVKSWEGYSAGGRGAYRASAYSKPALMLRTLENLMGWETMQRLLRTWARRHAFQHPTGDDFVAVADEVAGGRYHDLLLECIHGSATVDWAVEEARSLPVEPAEGFLLQQKPGDPVGVHFDPQPAEPGLLDVIRAHFGGAPEAVADAAPAAPERTFAGEVMVRNRGTLAVPVELELRYADGTVVRQTLDGKQPWYRIALEPKESELVAAVVDPDQKIALDLDVTNNGRLVRPDAGAARSFGAFFQFWVQSALAGVAWFS